jgi:hypothetical protein
MGCEIFPSKSKAIAFLKDRIIQDYKRTYKTDPDAFNIEMDEVIEPEMLFPYMYFLTEKIF